MDCRGELGALEELGEVCELKEEAAELRETCAGTGRTAQQDILLETFQRSPPGLYLAVSRVAPVII